MPPPRPRRESARTSADESHDAGLWLAIYEVVWSAGALQVIILMGHLVGVILFAVDDGEAVLRSLAAFSLFVWGLAGLYLIPTVVTHLTPAPCRGGGPLTDDYLDAPWLDGGKPEP
ncbi:MAG: hypothetical protein AB7I30_17675 [Isosphaeraceae bacterium]